MKWLFAALAIANIALAAIVVVLALRPPQERTVTIQRAMGGPLDAQTNEILRRLERDQRELEGKLAEVQQLRTLVAQLSERVRQCDETDKRDRTVPKQRREPPEPAEVTDTGTCDEVSCVLTNYEGACCAKLRTGKVPPLAPSPASQLPEMLDRQNISNAIAAVRTRVSACALKSPAKGKVKVSVRVDASGRVTSVAVVSTPDPVLGACVASAIQSAKFAPTQQGGSFSYPFIF
ncbi:MAG TPA: TonB family protein [Kofleriaceae bacterium]|nr:TonB family protein [Kofleriaceae bacterium]